MRNRSIALAIALLAGLPCAAGAQSQTLERIESISASGGLPSAGLSTHLQAAAFRLASTRNPPPAPPGFETASFAIVQQGCVSGRRVTRAFRGELEGALTLETTPLLSSASGDFSFTGYEQDQGPCPPEQGQPRGLTQTWELTGRLTLSATRQDVTAPIVAPCPCSPPPCPAARGALIFIHQADVTATITPDLPLLGGVEDGMTVPGEVYRQEGANLRGC